MQFSLCICCIVIGILINLVDLGIDHLLWKLGHSSRMLGGIVKGDLRR